MITLQNASRWYKQVLGVNDISCQIGPGITALLGPNGAGKSTMLKLITGQLRPTTGSVQVFGLAPFANPTVYRRMGYCPEIEENYTEMTGREFVTLLAALGDVPANTRAQRVSEVIETVGMTANADRKIGGYSKGMRQRIKVAQGIVHNPEVLILDEPLNGLDPVGRHDMSALLQDLAQQGKCILISSHILYEVEQLTRNILLLSKGRLMAHGDIYAIRGLIDRHPHRIAISTSRARELGKQLLDRPYILSVRFHATDASQLEIETHSPDVFYTHFPEIVLSGGYDVRSFDSPDNNLESVFKYLVNG